MKHSIIALKNIIRASLPALLMAVAASPCTGLGAKKEVPPDATDREIIQMAQQAFNTSNFKLSEHYYNVLLQRYGTNTVDYIIGKFEIAHIAIRKKDYETAVPILTEIIDIYDLLREHGISPAKDFYNGTEEDYNSVLREMERDGF